MFWPDSIGQYSTDIVPFSSRIYQSGDFDTFDCALYFNQGYWSVVVVYSRDIEVGDKKQKTGIIASLVINDTTRKVEAFKENPT